MIRPILQPCSVLGCTRAAGVILNGALLCGEHANEALAKRKEELRKGGPPAPDVDRGQGS